MKISKVVILAVTMCLPGLALAAEPANFKYAGNALAKQVCKAVVRDDVDRLKQVLRSYQNTLAYGYTYDLGGREIARDFTCNNMDLQEFSYHVGAHRVSGYFANDTGVPKEQVAVAAKKTVIEQRTN